MHPVRACLLAAEWKGNVRELKNMLESAIVMGQTDTIKPEDFPPDFLEKPAAGRGGAEAGMPAWLALSDYREARKQFEIAFINAKLREHGGNITRTAAAMGIHRQSLQEKVRELGIHAARE
jgi:DNA-binding NtrC family response regulator